MRARSVGCRFGLAVCYMRWNAQVYLRAGSWLAPDLEDSAHFLGSLPHSHEPEMPWLAIRLQNGCIDSITIVPDSDV